MDLSLLSSALLIGLFGSGHCLVMCGGIACAPSFTRAGAEAIGPLLLFNAGRIGGYTLIGTLAGLFGEGLAFSPTLLVVLRSSAAVLLILMGLHIGQWWSGVVVIERVGEPLWKRLAPVAVRLRQSRSRLAPLGLGLLWGWLPCGLVYSALVWALTSADSTTAALLMLFFGLGTLPSMISAGLFAYQFRRLLSHAGTRRVFGALMIVMGLWTLPQMQTLIGLHH